MKIERRGTRPGLGSGLFWGLVRFGACPRLGPGLSTKKAPTKSRESLPLPIQNSLHLLLNNHPNLHDRSHANLKLIRNVQFIVQLKNDIFHSSFPQFFLKLIVRLV